MTFPLFRKSPSSVFITKAVQGLQRIKWEKRGRIWSMAARLRSIMLILLRHTSWTPIKNSFTNSMKFFLFSPNVSACYRHYNFIAIFVIKKKRNKYLFFWMLLYVRISSKVRKEIFFFNITFRNIMKITLI